WSSIYNQPTAEFYHVTTDDATPYRVYGAQQDNSTISVPSRSSLSAITRAEWIEVGGGESGYIAVRPDDPNVIFAGNYQGYLTRYDRRTYQARNITVWPESLSGWGAKDAKYRFQWTYPILLSPHDPNVLYVTGNHVFRSTDEGTSWEVLSPDLTRNDMTKLEASGGPITKDNTGAEYYGTIFAFAESPLRAGLFWAGSDDGVIHLSRDGGKTWQNVTPKAKLLPEWALISLIEPSPHDPATAYVAATRYKLDDFKPYLLKTADYGQTWTKITTGLAEDDFTRAIREDPERRGLLYAGTETGLFVSFDDGAHWQSLRLNLPVVPIHDLVVKGTDLVVATHGRSFWILDDITPLRQLHESLPTGKTHLFAPRPAVRYTAGGWGSPSGEGKYYDMTGPFMVTTHPVAQRTGEKAHRPLDAGQNPPSGVVVLYYFKEKPEGEVRLTFLDADGQEIRSFTSEEKAEPKASSSAPDLKEEEEKKEPKVAKEAGANRFLWNMRLPDPKKVEGYVASEGAMSGPIVPPGTYMVRLTVGDQSLSET
ncbi:MAG: exo-alpha-sialidase, partial [Ktedonobacterales bacterium]|nr:exo-alpha-sialidase [Ktedonobacterales bacterium]